LKLRDISLPQKIGKVFRFRTLDGSMNFIPEGVITPISIADMDVYRSAIIILGSCEVISV
jgi:hypothetical protein